VPLDQFIRNRITEPLGMNDTFFFVPPEKKQRVVTVYMNDSTKRIRRAPEGPKGQGNYVDGPRRNFSGGAGLLSTARDYSRFLQMIANGGQLDGVRLLSPKTVRLMTTNQSGNLLSAFEPDYGFGLGFGINGSAGLASPGSYGWGGAYASMYNVDPKEKIIIVFMMNQLPNSSDVNGKFQNLVYHALVESRM
jgi:CubicO group peptidase (beta-lactamase class C family)